MTSNGARPDTVTTVRSNGGPVDPAPRSGAADERPGQASAGPRRTPPALPGDEPHGTSEGPPGRGRRPRTEVRRLALLALVVVVAAAGLGAVASLFFPAQYAGRAELLYPISVEQPTGFLREDRELTTQLLLIGSRAVLEPVAVERGIDVADLQERTSVEVVDSSEIIAVEVRAPSRDEGVALVGAVVERYLVIADEQRADPARAYVVAELEATRRELADEPDDPNLLERERALVAQLDSLTADELSRPDPSVLVAPYSPTDPVGVGMPTTTAVGFLLGVLAAGALVLVSARRPPRPPSGPDVQRDHG